MYDFPPKSSRNTHTQIKYDGRKMLAKDEGAKGAKKKTFVFGVEHFLTPPLTLTPKVVQEPGGGS